MRIKNLMIAVVLLLVCGCGQAGWIGYYSITKSDGTKNKISYNSENGILTSFGGNKKLWVNLPRGCSGFSTIGFITPVTPPIPLINFRQISIFDTSCNYFTIKTKPRANVILLTNGQKFEPEISEARFGYTKYKFPIKAKNIDKGTIIIEKDKEKIEVPFKYEYFRFWY